MSTATPELGSPEWKKAFDKRRRLFNAGYRARTLVIRANGVKIRLQAYFHRVSVEAAIAASTK